MELLLRAFPSSQCLTMELFVPKSSIVRHWEEMGKGRKHRDTRAWLAWSEAVPRYALAGQASHELAHPPVICPGELICPVQAHQPAR